MSERIFSQDDQDGFAALSGDFNPMHVDAQTARRLMFARPVVHGVHGVLWALDGWLRRGGPALRLDRIEARFQAPICVGDKVSWRELPASAGRPNRRKLALTVAGRRVSTITLDVVPRDPGAADIALPRDLPPPHCRARAESDLQTAHGDLPLALEPAALARRFPALARRLPAWQIAQLLASTRLVGMECPGLHSVFSRLEFDFGSDPATHAPLCWQTESYDPRFRFLRLALSGAGIRGRIDALVRTPPVDQPSLEELPEFISPETFAGQRVLIVGGSRGIGETAAKLLAIGGAEVRITYVAGTADADRVVETLQGAGLRADAQFLDILNLDSRTRTALADWQPSDLYFFATPPIVPTRDRRFSSEIFRHFSDFYVGGFVDLVQSLSQDRLRRIFYPSSIYVEERPAKFTEYVAAKLAGEAACAGLVRLNRELSILCPRLPRLATDQTGGDGAPVASELFGPMRALQDLAPGSFETEPKATLRSDMKSMSSHEARS